MERLHTTYAEGTFKELDENYSNWFEACHNRNCHNGVGKDENGKCVCECNNDHFEGENCNTRANTNSFDFKFERRFYA